SEMLERQRTGCPDYLPLVDAARKSGLFPEFLRRAQFQFELIRATALCDRGEHSPARCADVSALAAPLILRWRRADAIMRALAGPATEEGSVAAEMAPIPDPEPAAEDAAEAPRESERPEEGNEAESLRPAISAPGIPLPQPRPDVRQETVSDFLPDTSSLSGETADRYRLPLAPPE